MYSTRPFSIDYLFIVSRLFNDSLIKQSIDPLINYINCKAILSCHLIWHWNQNATEIQTLINQKVFPSGDQQIEQKQFVGSL